MRRNRMRRRRRNQAHDTKIRRLTKIKFAQWPVSLKRRHRCMYICRVRLIRSAKSVDVQRSVRYIIARDLTSFQSFSLRRASRSEQFSTAKYSSNFSKRTRRSFYSTHGGLRRLAIKSDLSRTFEIN